MDRVWNWAIRKVQQTERASDVILKDELFQSFQVENPDLPRDTFLSFFGRFMGNAPFDSVAPLQKRRKNVGFCYLSFKSNETTEKNLNVSLARPRENSSKCERYLSDDEAQSTRVEEISNEYQNGTSKIAKKRKSYHNMADVILKNKFLMNHKGKNQNRLPVIVVPKKGNLVLKTQIYQKRLVGKEHLSVKSKQLTQ